MLCYEIVVLGSTAQIKSEGVYNRVSKPVIRSTKSLSLQNENHV